MKLWTHGGGAYELSSKIEEGSDGIVYLGKNCKDETTVAIKIKKRAFGKEKGCREIQHNKLLNRFNISGVCKMLDYGFLETPNGMRKGVMVFEHMPMDLYHFANNYEPSETEAKKIIMQVITTLVELLTCGIVPMDLKEENILINPDTLEIKLCDFAGLASTYELFTQTSTNWATPVYSPPECLEKDQFFPTRSVTWQIGLLTYSILNCAPLPWKNKYDGREACTFPYRENISVPARQFVSFCLERDVFARPDLVNLSHHPWFVNN